eukprot:TRINITY_DN808_c1_g1_i4.p1 TRINITY_DN808_c1_g1~~TRINITY_DN808_c1_g1_i4.p1  ORF type:complete len:880 (+),score=125.75 TRINITY_DN808_c1_g1_i4:232-2640(+)
MSAERQDTVPLGLRSSPSPPATRARVLRSASRTSTSSLTRSRSSVSRSPPMPGPGPMSAKRSASVCSYFDEKEFRRLEDERNKSVAYGVALLKRNKKLEQQLCEATVDAETHRIENSQLKATLKAVCDRERRRDAEWMYIQEEIGEKDQQNEVLRVQLEMQSGRVIRRSVSPIQSVPSWSPVTATPRQRGYYMSVSRSPSTAARSCSPSVSVRAPPGQDMGTQTTPEQRRRDDERCALRVAPAREASPSLGRPDGSESSTPLRRSSVTADGSPSPAPPQAAPSPTHRSVVSPPAKSRATVSPSRARERSESVSRCGTDASLDGVCFGVSLGDELQRAQQKDEVIVSERPKRQLVEDEEQRAFERLSMHEVKSAMQAARPHKLWGQIGENLVRQERYIRDRVGDQELTARELLSEDFVGLMPSVRRCRSLSTARSDSMQQRRTGRRRAEPTTPVSRRCAAKPITPPAQRRAAAAGATQRGQRPGARSRSNPPEPPVRVPTTSTSPPQPTYAYTEHDQRTPVRVRRFVSRPTVSAVNAAGPTVTKCVSPRPIGRVFGGTAKTMASTAPHSYVRRTLGEINPNTAHVQATQKQERMYTGIMPVSQVLDVKCADWCKLREHVLRVTPLMGSRISQMNETRAKEKMFKIAHQNLKRVLLGVARRPLQPGAKWNLTASEIMRIDEHHRGEVQLALQEIVIALDLMRGVHRESAMTVDEVRDNIPSLLLLAQWACERDVVFQTIGQATPSRSVSRARSVSPRPVVSHACTTPATSLRTRSLSLAPSTMDRDSRSPTPRVYRMSPGIRVR